jgi:hypothetical protein
MAKSLVDYRSALLDRLLTMLWRQWTALGVLGASSSEDERIVDPEALLIFSLEVARYEPRLFDEVLAWLEVNGEWLDNARLRRLISAQDGHVIRLVGAVLRYLTDHGQGRKWGNLATFCERNAPPMGGVLEPLFMTPAGLFHPRAEGDAIDRSFSVFGFNRPRLKIQKKAKDVPVNAASNLRILMRSLFGVGARSEALLYLMTHSAGGTKEIADATGHFWLSVHQALSALGKSGLVLKKQSGRKVEHWLARPKWWQFLAGTDHRYASEPIWLNWGVIFPSIAVIWRTFDELSRSEPSEYMRGSRLMDVQTNVETLAREFARAGYNLGDVPSGGLPLDLYQQSLFRFLGTIFDLRVKESAASASR